MRAPVTQVYAPAQAFSPTTTATATNLSTCALCFCVGSLAGVGGVSDPQPARLASSFADGLF
jgi:hypothetical protein